MAFAEAALPRASAAPLYGSCGARSTPNASEKPKRDPALRGPGHGGSAPGPCDGGRALHAPTRAQPDPAAAGARQLLCAPAGCFRAPLGVGPTSGERSCALPVQPGGGLAQFSGPLRAHSGRLQRPAGPPERLSGLRLRSRSSTRSGSERPGASGEGARHVTPGARPPNQKAPRRRSSGPSGPAALHRAQGARHCGSTRPGSGGAAAPRPSRPSGQPPHGWAARSAPMRDARGLAQGRQSRPGHARGAIRSGLGLMAKGWPRGLRGVRVRTSGNRASRFRGAPRRQKAGRPSLPQAPPRGDARRHGARDCARGGRTLRSVHIQMHNISLCIQ
eukprot:gnl/Chilomastix_cuspidata/5992.p1 GENE.gnl/Chilomastix_cuspidata/5992~~gnl/Chilomastix_cuspidata/5992.p1  ORF type:complete len:332 (+),score=-25.60 gnl/Chilomastix_cuspidata/5992:792-1787(+)